MALTQAISAQSSSGEKVEANVATPEKIEVSAENKQRITEILRETSAMSAMLRSPYNRIHFTLKSASTLWKLDEKEARAMLSVAMNDIRQIIVESDAEINRIENDAETDVSQISGGNELWVKTNRITTLRSALINQLANLDPEWGFNFLQETIKAVTNQELKTRIEGNDKYLESMLIGRIAEKDTSKALDLGRKKLSEGVSSEVVNLLQTIYGKDKEKGAAFAEDVLKQIKLSGIDPNSSWTLSNLYSFGVANIEEITKEKSNDKPIFSEQSLRDLAVLLAKQITDPLNNNNYYGLTPEFVASLQKYAPQQTMQIKKTAELQKLRAEREKARYEKSSNFNGSIQKMYEAQSKFQNEIGTKMQGLTDTNINSEQKKKIIEETKSKILESGNKSLRFTSLISLATQAANVGEKEIAIDVLEKAETFINLQPKEMREFTEVWTLAGGYASLKPERSFALVEDTIFRLNDVINAYVKFSEFQSGQAVIENDELRMGDSGGQVFGFFYYSGDLIGKLAEADFKRAKGLADKFERPEFRIETRLMIAANISQPQFNNMRRITPIISINRGFHFSGN
ncbi:MAG: hypothetical protein ABR566_10625 [Pyrinomonadaceae bacterium]